jgi:2-keto-3-deoxy-L-rhamnonate aldolase RhmA
MAATVLNVARKKLEQGQLSLGVGVRMTRSVEIAKAMAVAGFDWLFLDMEHAVMSLEACAQISIAALDAGIAPIARVPTANMRLLRGLSIMVPSALSCRMSTVQPKPARSLIG